MVLSHHSVSLNDTNRGGKIGVVQVEEKEEEEEGEEISEAV